MSNTKCFQCRGVGNFGTVYRGDGKLMKTDTCHHCNGTGVIEDTKTDNYHVDPVSGEYIFEDTKEPSSSESLEEQLKDILVNFCHKMELNPATPLEVGEKTIPEQSVEALLNLIHRREQEAAISALKVMAIRLSNKSETVSRDSFIEYISREIKSLTPNEVTGE
jgi:hypothetical protein